MNQKNFVKFNTGQISIAWILGIGVTVAMASVASFSASVKTTENKIEGIKDNTAISLQRISVIETKSFQYEKDIISINNKLDKILEKIR